MRLLAPFVLIALVLALVVGTDSTRDRADLVVANSTDVFTLDPQRQSYLNDFRMTYALYEGLVRWDNGDFTIEPAAAAAMPEVSDDRLTWRFTIRSDARWSSGDPVTAHDFAWSWMRLLLPDTAADYSAMLFCVRGAEEFWRWRAHQLERFAADPFTAALSDRAAAARAAAERALALLDDPALPAELRSACDPLRADARHEAAAIVAAGNDAAVERALEDSPALADLLARLRSGSCRAAEAQWMWRGAERRFDESVEIRAVDDRVLEIELVRPLPYLLDLLCFAVCAPVHRPSVEGWPEPERARAARHPRGWAGVEPPPWPQRRWVGLDAATGRFEQQHQWARPGSLVSNGPYVLAAWRYKRDLRLERNPFYHTPSLARSGSIVAITIEDANTRVLAFATGGIDWLGEVGTEYEPDMLAEARAYERRHAAALDEALAAGLDRDAALASLPPPRDGERRDIHALPAFGTDFYSFNCRPNLADGRANPFHHAAVRRAFVMATDRGAIVEHATRLGEPVVSTLVPPGSIPGYSSPQGLGFAPDDARRELAAAGWSDRNGDGLIEDASGRPFPVIDMLYTTSTPRYGWISLALKAQWEQRLGVRVELRGIDTKFFRDDLRRGRFMVGRGRWYGDYGDPTTFLELCRSTDGNNDFGYASAHVDAMLDAAAVEADPERRLELLAECERYLMQEEVPMLVICQLVQVYMYEPGTLRGLSRHPRLTQHLWQMRAERR